MNGVFTVSSSMCDDPTGNYNKVPEAGASPIDMFYSMEDLDLDLVKNWSEYAMMAGESYMVENLQWSGKRILNSVSTALRSKVIEKIIKWPVEFKTGPVYLKLVMQFIEESTPKSSRNLVNKLQKLAVTDYNG